MQMIIQTPADAFERYKAFKTDGRLVQGVWISSENDGRQIACGLGVLGVTSAAQCPAQIMPRWLAQMVPYFFDNQDPVDAFDWGERFYAELSRTNGNVPFSVVHDWQANVVGPLAIAVATKSKRDVKPHQDKAELHRRALSGDVASKQEWVEKLRPAYANAYANAYADADADANADANAYAYADAYANAYADADAYVYNANANANAYYTDAYAYADVYANAYAYADADADANAEKRDAVKRLADGMIDCLKRLPSEVA
jgi:hypothetical protein